MVNLERRRGRGRRSRSSSVSSKSSYSRSSSRDKSIARERKRRRRFKDSRSASKSKEDDSKVASGKPSVTHLNEDEPRRKHDIPNPRNRNSSRLPDRLCRFADFEKIGHAHTERSTKRTLTEFGDTMKRPVGGKAVKSATGFVVVCSGIDPKCDPEMIEDRFLEGGSVKKLLLPKDLKSGLLKGFATIFYENEFDADRVVKEMNGKELSGQVLKVGWAFVDTWKERQGKRR